MGSLGSKVSQLLCVKNPWKEHCGRKDCFPCMTKGGQCMVQNITYRKVCNHCTKEGRKSEYIGESSRTGYDRGADHFKALTSKDQTNPLVEHWQDSHHGIERDFSMTI